MTNINTWSRYQQDNYSDEVSWSLKQTILIKIHEDWSKIVAYGVHTSDLVFGPTWPTFELNKYTTKDKYSDEVS